MPLVDGRNVFRYGVDKLDSLASAFGIKILKKGATDTQKLKLLEQDFRLQKAKEILGEAGKTISDADRALVEKIVGDLRAFW